MRKTIVRRERGGLYGIVAGPEAEWYGWQDTALDKVAGERVRGLYFGLRAFHDMLREQCAESGEMYHRCGVPGLRY